jgi:hypothetical protein
MVYLNASIQRLAAIVLLFALLNQFIRTEGKAADFQPQETVGSSLFSRSLVGLGDPTRLQRVLAKARRSEVVTVGVIGGSITQGAGAPRSGVAIASIIFGARSIPISMDAAAGSRLRKLPAMGLWLSGPWDKCN